MSATPPRYETLDSEALGPGAPYSAHAAKTMDVARQRLARKEVLLGVLPWPASTFAAKYEVALVYNRWVRAVAELCLPKPWALRAGYACLSYDADTTADLWVGTRARPFPRLLTRTVGAYSTIMGPVVGPNTGAITGTGLDITDRIPLTMGYGDTEVFELWLRRNDPAGSTTENVTLLGLGLIGLRAT